MVGYSNLLRRSVPRVLVKRSRSPPRASLPATMALVGSLICHLSGISRIIPSTLCLLSSFIIHGASFTVWSLQDADSDKVDTLFRRLAKAANAMRQKLAVAGAYKRRFFVLNGSILTYYRDETLVAQSGRIDLNTGTCSGTRFVSTLGLLPCEMITHHLA